MPCSRKGHLARGAFVLYFPPKPNVYKGEFVQTGAVLVVDDDFDGAESIVDVLEREGIAACSAKDGREGIYEMRARGDIAAVILDLDMAMMDGAGFRKEQLSDPVLAKVPVIVISGRADYAEQANTLGAAAAIQKPFRSAALLEALKSLP
jgi:two-component system, chemotaxis family, sensor histidine kinase and response regulator PixL